MNCYKNILWSSVFALIIGCQGKHTPMEFGYYFDENTQTEILAQIISYVYTTPSNVPKSERFLPIYRELYKKETHRFEMIHFWKSAEGEYYFYLLRPARNIHNHKRGVAGIFTLDKNMEIQTFKEAFVTKMIPEEQVINFGSLVFQDFIESAENIPMNPLRQDIIEFPNDQTRYDGTRFEWTYSLE